jgi:hypothetical protein
MSAVILRKGITNRMKIIGVEGLTSSQISKEVERGARFVFYQYCISVIILTFKRSSDVYYVPPGESVTTKGLGYSIISLLFGWWGFPWGPIYTIQTVWNNFSGGHDVTFEILSAIPDEAPR